MLQSPTPWCPRITGATRGEMLTCWIQRSEDEDVIRLLRLAGPPFYAHLSFGTCKTNSAVSIDRAVDGGERVWYRLQGRIVRYKERRKSTLRWGDANLRRFEAMAKEKGADMRGFHEFARLHTAGPSTMQLLSSVCITDSWCNTHPNLYVINNRSQFVRFFINTVSYQADVKPESKLYRIIMVF